MAARPGSTSSVLRGGEIQNDLVWVSVTRAPRSGGSNMASAAGPRRAPGGDGWSPNSAKPAPPSPPSRGQREGDDARGRCCCAPGEHWFSSLKIRPGTWNGALERRIRVSRWSPEALTQGWGRFPAPGADCSWTCVPARGPRALDGRGAEATSLPRPQENTRTGRILESRFSGACSLPTG